VTYVHLELYCVVIELELGVLEKKGRVLIEGALYLTQRSFKVKGQRDLFSAASVVCFTLLKGQEVEGIFLFLHLEETEE
jgi:hypothetical protein